MTSGSRLRGSAWALALALLAAFALPRPAAAALYGLVIGIDDYVGTKNDLEGAVNDAKDIAKALETAGAAEVVLLLDAQASKDKIAASWDRLVARAGPGDTILFSYAGHGSQEPEPPDRAAEADGKNENFLLGRFEPQGPGTRERIVDDEIFEWLSRADDKQIRVVFVADSCHSGSMHRAVRSNVVRFRNATIPDITDDQLDFPPPAVARLKETDFDTVTFVGATSEDRLTPEVTIDGQKRGALSWAIARALEGKADKDGDGEVTQLELLSFVVPAVHAHVESQQTPQVAPLKARSVRLFSVRSASAPASAPAPAPVAAPAPAPSPAAIPDDALRVAVDGKGTLSPQPFVSVVSTGAQADVIWNTVTGVVEHVVGGVVAEHVGQQQIGAVLGKWAALKWLRHHAASDPVNVVLPHGNQRYARGQEVAVQISGARYPHLTMFNLPPDGRVEFFIPDPLKAEEAREDWRGRTIKERFRVQNPPFGAEHLVAIFSSEILSALHAALAQMKTAGEAGALRKTLEAMLKNQEFQVGVLHVYTGAGG